MSFQKIRTPDHLLVRWSETTGQIQGAQVVYTEKVIEDGVLISAKHGDPMPVSIANEAGFPLATILGDVNTSALIDIEAKAAQIAALQASIATLTQGKETAEQARDAALAHAQTLQTELDSYTSPVSVNGVPEWVYKSQAYKALTVAGKMETLQSALVAAAAQSMAGKLAKVDFDTAARFHRSHPTVAMFISSGLFTASEVDALFKLAITFPV